MRPTVIRALAALLVVLVGTGGFFAVAEWTDDNGNKRRVQVGRDFERVDVKGVPAAQDPVVDRDQEQQPDEVIEAHDSRPGETPPLGADPTPNGPEPAPSVDLHEDTRDETPPGVTPEQLKEGAKKTEALQEKEALEPEEPAGAQAYRCVRRPVVNQSALSGPYAARGRQHGVALHFTVSDPGSLFAIRDLFNRPSFGASSNYGWDWAAPRGDYCHVWVDVGRKAWAQGAANSAYVSIEIHTRDRSRASWIANLRDGRLAALVRDLAKQTGAPLRLVDPQGCVFPPGLTDHDRLECGNTHWDVGKNFPWDYFLAQVRQGSTPNPLTAEQKRACDTLNFHRRRAHRIGRWFPSRRQRAEQLKRQIPTGRCKSKYRGEPGRR